MFVVDKRQQSTKKNQTYKRDEHEKNICLICDFFCLFFVVENTMEMGIKRASGRRIKKLS